MPTVTFILGLCGSGKSKFAELLKDVNLIDERFFDRKDELIKALTAGKNCAIVEIALCKEDMRDQIVRDLQGSVPNLKINWVCIENDLAKANANCKRERKDKDPADYNPAGHIHMNTQIYGPAYTYPEGAIILKMWPYAPDIRQDCPGNPDGTISN
jgi:hypothetical protein